MEPYANKGPLFLKVQAALTQEIWHSFKVTDWFVWFL